MDRNQAKDLFRKDKDAYGKPKSVMKKIDLIYDDFHSNLYNINELRHITVNFAINCLNGYNGDFDSWFKNINGEWRDIANRK